MARPSVDPNAAGAIFTDGQAMQYCIFTPLISGTKGAPEPLGLHFQSGDLIVFGGQGRIFTRGVDDIRKRSGGHSPPTPPSPKGGNLSQVALRRTIGWASQPFSKYAINPPYPSDQKWGIQQPRANS